MTGGTVIAESIIQNENRREARMLGYAEYHGYADEHVYVNLLAYRE
jgi:hypothetical protein